MLGAERLDVFPSGGCCRLPFPVDQHLSDATGEPIAHRTFRLRSNRAMVHGRQGRWSVRRRPFELLEDAHMEHVVKTGAGRKSEANRDLVDQLDDAVGAVVARSELSRRSLRKRRCCAMPKPEKGPVAHLVSHMTVARVVVALLECLRLL